MRFSRDYSEFFDMSAADPRIVKQMREDVEKSLRVLLDRLGLPFDSVNYLIERWWWKMTEPGRHYHTPVHVMGMFDTADRHRIHLDAVQELAIWFHDAVYDPHARPGENENRSAAWLIRLLNEAQVQHETGDGAAELIRWTAHHTDPDVPSPYAIIMDLDLSGLSSSPENFSRQSEAVRAEFRHLSDRDYARNTIGFFTRLLERKFIYRTPYFKPFEAIAREQLKTETERLGKTVEAQV